MITGCVYVDLTVDPGQEDITRDRRQLARLQQAPAGARVVVDIGSRHYVSPDAAHWLNHYGEDLIIEIRGTDPSTVAWFVKAARSGDAWRVVA